MSSIIRRTATAVTAFHPGKNLAEEPKELNVSGAAFARWLNVPANCITEILNGRRAVTRDTALCLSHFLGTSADSWLNLKALYERRLAENKVSKRPNGDHSQRGNA